jgi:NifU-like protein involved in Fe-S cluster formation
MDLYHPRVLELAADIAHIGALHAPQGSSTKVSRVCGSVVSVDLALEGDRVADIGLEVQACALGQAAASVLARHAIGATIAEIAAARDALYAMLKQSGPPPHGRFWELRHLEGVKDYPPRHASTMLAFDAAVEAIGQARAGLSISGAGRVIEPT